MKRPFCWRRLAVAGVVSMYTFAGPHSALAAGDVTASPLERVAASETKIEKELAEAAARIAVAREEPLRVMESLKSGDATGPTGSEGTAKAEQARAEAAHGGPDAVIQYLQRGNSRFVEGKCVHAGQDAHRRQELASGQHPLAIVLTCADSRVPPEILFDQGLGDLFVIRNAGNVLDDHTLGSMEYAVEHLHAGLVVVLGHAKCGAVSAAVAGGHVEGHIHSVTESLAPAVKESKGQPGDPVENAVRANARMVADTVAHSAPILSKETEAGKLRIAAACYDLATGNVEWLPLKASGEVQAHP